MAKLFDHLRVVLLETWGDFCRAVIIMVIHEVCGLLKAQVCLVWTMSEIHHHQMEEKQWPRPSVGNVEPYVSAGSMQDVPELPQVHLDHSVVQTGMDIARHVPSLI